MKTQRMVNSRNTRFVLCIDNTEYPASLESRKVYLVLPDPEARAYGQLRVIDESGEDYLYPSSLFLTGVRFPWDRVRRTGADRFSRDAKLLWKAAQAKTPKKSR